MVMLDIGQPPQAPVSLTFTRSPSIATNWISPPSACRAGRIVSNACSIFSFILLPPFFIHVHDDASLSEIAQYQLRLTATSSSTSQPRQKVLLKIILPAH